MMPKADLAVLVDLTPGQAGRPRRRLVFCVYFFISWKYLESIWYSFGMCLVRMRVYVVEAIVLFVISFQTSDRITEHVQG